MKPHKALLLVALLAAQTAGANTITVTTTADSGAGTLRAAIASAADGDTINFSVSGTILLTNFGFYVNKSLTIAGPGPNSLAVDANASGRVFWIAPSNIVTIANLTITNGFTGSDYGGAIWNDHSILTISNCTISGNSNWYGGGGIYNDGTFRFGGPSSATLEIVHSTLSGNMTGGGGGAIWNISGGSGASAVVRILGSTISGNSAGSGGGIFNLSFVSGDASLEIANSTFSGNSAPDYYGGGVRNYTDRGIARVVVVNSTFHGNSARSDSAGGINSENYQHSGVSSLAIGGTILNAGASGNNISDDAGTVTSLGYNLSSDGGGGFLTSTGDQINTDPLLLPLWDNGGPTLTHALLGCSPAIDQSRNFSGSVNDQRGAGFARTVDDSTVVDPSGGDSTDIGAVEAQPTGAAEQVGDLIIYVQALPIDSGVKNGLLVKLQDALKGVDTGNKPKACSALQDFINLSNAQLAKRKLTAAQANTLICEATRIRAVIGCK